MVIAEHAWHHLILNYMPALLKNINNVKFSPSSIRKKDFMAIGGIIRCTALLVPLSLMGQGQSGGGATSPKTIDKVFQPSKTRALYPNAPLG